MKTEVKNEQLIVLTDLITVLSGNTENGNGYAVFEERVPPLGGPPPHTHPDEEIFYVVEGEFEFILNDLQNPFKALPGSVIHVPSNAVHTFKNVGSTAGKMVVILSPGTLLDYFRVIGNKVETETDIPDLSRIPDISSIDISRAFNHAPEHNVQFVLPEIMEN
ncbi:cupin domain-containing protein [Maribellus sediminis]|uniref:cupin domain-containing protein n=1 Tax=Maribellus sediminis TaxID=2696285 RepID=UPI001430EF88|nr:cupin domain-containing protein [Maribellus sediminis]